ncbi:MAG TPA: LysR family transcriptional regulator [Xanthobacteraceae bacterium]|nr:LysR family transcriptional regulator [Xanthobacteraceae bacterium]
MHWAGSAPFRCDETSARVSIELKHLRYPEVAERCGSFRKAADLLALKQSDLSRRVRRIPNWRPRRDLNARADWPADSPV